MLRVKLSPVATGIVQGAGVVFYVFLINVLIRLMAGRGVGDPFTILLLFSFSALVCGAILFAYPLVLLTKKRIRDMVLVLLATIATFAVLLALRMTYLLLLSPPLPVW